MSSFRYSGVFRVKSCPWTLKSDVSDVSTPLLSPSSSREREPSEGGSTVMNTPVDYSLDFFNYCLGICRDSGRLEEGEGRA